MKLEEILRKNRPKLSDSSIKTYISNLTSLSRMCNLLIEKPKDVVDNLDKILKCLEPINVNSRKTKLASMVILTETEKDYKGKKETLEILRERMSADLETIRKKDVAQELSETQKKNFIKWEDVLKIYDELEKMVQPTWDKKKWDITDYMICQKYVLLSLYVLNPPRRSKDYIMMKIRNVDRLKHNYIKKSKKPNFVFNDFKTVGKIGSQEVDIPFKLYSILTKWAKRAPTDWLITNSSFKRPAPSFITRELNAIFGKKMSSNLLRHSFVTHKFGDVSLSDLEKTAKDMGGSEISRTLSYVSKEHSKKKEE